MAGKLLDAGHELFVHDISEDAMRPLLERQARQAASPKELADICDTVIVSLPTLEIFQHALSGPDGLLAGKALKTLVNTCTVGGPFIRMVEQECTAAGCHRHRRPDLRRRRGRRGRHAGRDGVRRTGQGCRTDAAVPAVGQDGRGRRRQARGRADDEAHQHLLFAVALVATSEAMTMSGQAGIPPETMLQVLNNGTGRNFITMQVFPKTILPGSFDFGATIEILMKDLSGQHLQGLGALAELLRKIDGGHIDKGDIQDFAAVVAPVRIETYKGSVDLRMPRDSHFDLAIDLGRRGGDPDSDFARYVGHPTCAIERIDHRSSGGPEVRVRSYKGEFRMHAR